MDTISTPRTRLPITVAVAGAMAGVLAALMTGCGGGDTNSSSTSGGGVSSDAGASTVESSPGPAEPAAAAGRSGTDAAASSKTSQGSPGSGGLLADPLAGTKRVRTADLSVLVKDLPQAAARVRAAAQRLGGSVASENSQSAATGSVAQDVIVVRVPEPKLDEAIGAVAATGTELTRTTNSQDVTAVLADLESRESSQRASVARVRALMAKATTLQDIVLLEAELARRETDLEAAQASRRSMADQAAQATLTVTLTTGRHVVDADTRNDNGFVAGLRKSWHALQASTGFLLTILGATLPVIVALVIIGWPAYLIARRYRPSRRAPGGNATPHPTPDAHS